MAKTIITIEIGEPKKGKRAVLISGAPAGEMPVIRNGVFADLHPLVNAVWADLLRREPQVPKIAATKTSATKAKADKAGQLQDDGDTDGDEQPTTEPAEELPVIANDPAATQTEETTDDNSDE